MMKEKDMSHFQIPWKYLVSKYLETLGENLISLNKISYQLVSFVHLIAQSSPWLGVRLGYQQLKQEIMK